MPELARNVRALELASSARRPSHPPPGSKKADFGAARSEPSSAAPKKIQIRIPKAQRAHRIEAIPLHARGDSRSSSSGKLVPKVPFLNPAPRTPRDLRELRVLQLRGSARRTCAATRKLRAKASNQPQTERRSPPNSRPPRLNSAPERCARRARAPPAHTAVPPRRLAQPAASVYSSFSENATSALRGLSRESFVLPAKRASTTAGARLAAPRHQAR